VSLFKATQFVPPDQTGLAAKQQNKDNIKQKEKQKERKNPFLLY
jgi:hypothetical protein